MSERRRSTRQKSFLRGCIYFNNKRSATDCLVRDISAAGARLIFSDTVSIPDAVDLYIPQKEETLRAHVQWRHGDEVGVAFAKGAQAPSPARSLDVGELAERVTRLEAELAAVRKMLKRLKAEVAGDADEAA
jgi:PilZ domain